MPASLVWQWASVALRSVLSPDLEDTAAGPVLTGLAATSGILCTVDSPDVVEKYRNQANAAFQAVSDALSEDLALLMRRAHSFPREVRDVADEAVATDRASFTMANGRAKCVLPIPAIREHQVADLALPDLTLGRADYVYLRVVFESRWKDGHAAEVTATTHLQRARATAQVRDEDVK